MYNIIVYNRAGEPLADLSKAAHNVSVAYALNGGRNLSFDILSSAYEATQANLAIGNIIVAYHDQCEPWSGIIKAPRWLGHVVTYNVAPIIARLRKRNCRPHRWDGVPPGSVLVDLLNMANLRYSTGINLGTTIHDLPNITTECYTEKVLDKLDEIVALAHVEWQLTMVHPAVWEISFYRQIGRDLTGSVVIEYGVDTSGEPEYGEDDEVQVSAILALGKRPQTEGDATPEQEWDARPKAFYENIEATLRDGYSEDAVEFPDIDDLAMLMQQAQREQEKREYPDRRAALTLNNTRRLWSLLRDGDIVCLFLPKYGYSGLSLPVRILGREVNDASDTMTMVIEVVVGAQAEPLDMFRRANYPTGGGMTTLPATFPSVLAPVLEESDFTWDGDSPVFDLGG